MKSVAVIGGGPGGYVASIRLAQLGASVTLIEKHKIGGTCLNYGCIPTKTLHKNAEILETLRHIDRFGIQIDGFSLDATKVKERKDEVVEKLVSGIEQLLSANKVEVIFGEAKFESPHTLSILLENGDVQTKTFDDIIIATGSDSQRLPLQGIDLPGVLTSKEILDLDFIPEKLLVVGGGVIGMEFASIFSSLGSTVEVIQKIDRILEEVDGEIVKRYTATLKKKGITLHKNVDISHIEQTDKGLKILGTQKTAEVSYEGTHILMATGRKAFYQGLNLDKIGVSIGAKGIEVNSDFQTNVPHVYAIGDVNGQLMLAHVASHQGVSAAEVIMGMKPAGNHHVVPNCIFLFPEIACVGINEEQAKEKNIPIKVSKFPFIANGKALSIDETEGFVKVICDPEGLILGVHIMGPHASDLIHEGTLAIAQKIRVDAIANTIHAHPTLSESFAEASLGILDAAIHLAPNTKKKGASI